VEFQDVVRRRRMVRRYADQALPDGLADDLAAVALRAPSAGFTQGVSLLVLESAAERDRFWTAVEPEGPATAWARSLRTAPLLILLWTNQTAYVDRYAEPDKGWTDRDESHWTAPYWYIDTGMAALLMLQTVVDEGLGACLFGPPAEKVGRLKKEFGVPDGFDPIGVISIGYRAPDKRSPSLKRGRRGTTEVVHRGHWGSHEG